MVFLKDFIVVTVLAAVTLVSAQQATRPLSTYEIVFSWQQLDFEFDLVYTRDVKTRNHEFIEINNVITGIKMTEDRMFLTVPRWRLGVPATLVYLKYSQNSTVPGMATDPNNVASPQLIPYPSWEMQEIGNCNAFQYVQSMEIDQYNRMWIIDIGRINIFTEPMNKCPPKLVIMDLGTNKVISTYEFPSDVVSKTKNFLNDLVVGCHAKDDCWAYITDSSESKIVIYTLKNNKAWSVQHPSMVASDDAKNFTILDRVYVFNTQVDGIALSPLDSHFDKLYYCPLSSYNIYSIPTKVLQSEPWTSGGNQLADSDVTLEGTKTSQSDGLAMDSNGLLFYGLLTDNSVNYWNTTSGKLNVSDGELVVRNDIDLQWPDTFAFDGHGNLYVVTNRLHRYSVDTLDPKEKNFRVARMFIGTNSYMHSANEVVVPITMDQSGLSTSTPNYDSSSTDDSSSVVPGHGSNLDYHPGSQYEHIGQDHDHNHDHNNHDNSGSTTNSPAAQQSTTRKSPNSSENSNGGRGTNFYSSVLITLLLLSLSLGVFN